MEVSAIFILYADKTKLSIRQREQMTSGSVNIYHARFEFSADWDRLAHVAVFRAGGEARSVLLDETGECAIPWETLKKPMVPLEAGVYGTQNGNTVLPTVWANLGVIHPGAAPGELSIPPTPELWQQELDRKGDRLDYTADGDLGLYAGNKLLSAVPMQGGGEDSGTSDHRKLSNRDAEQQHPIAAIDGLSEELERIPEPVEPLTNEDLEELLK